LKDYVLDMTLLKYIERLEQMDQLIRMKATGSSKEFADKLGISRILMMQELNVLKELGADIAYDKKRQTYYYKKRMKLFFGFLPKSDDTSKDF
jgi:biotin operon repressor